MAKTQDQYRCTALQNPGAQRSCRPAWRTGLAHHGAVRKLVASPRALASLPEGARLAAQALGCRVARAGGRAAGLGKLV